MSAESDLLKGIIKLRKDGWMQGMLGNRALGAGPACLVGCLADDYEETPAIALLSDMLKETCDSCADYVFSCSGPELVYRHNDHHINDVDEAVSVLKKALARA